jgi:cell wall-associated NlpC family hydrolase
MREFTEQMRQQAIEAYPLEAVWLITPGECRQVKNVHVDPENYFSVSKRVLASALSRGLLAVVHSHPNGIHAPSEADMLSQLALGVPFGLLTTDGEFASDLLWWGADTPVEPLLGRGFRHGTSDCYALIRDYYRTEKDVLLPEFPRSWKWWESGGEGFMAGYEKAGFVQIDQAEAREGDVWLAQLRSPVPNHGGVLLDNNMMMHQAGGTEPVDLSRLSIREPIHRYVSLITHWLRYEGPAQ